MPNLIRPEGPEPDDFRFSRRALATGVVGGLAFAELPAGGIELQLHRIVLIDPDGETVGRGIDFGQTGIAAVLEGDDLNLPVFVAVQRFGLRLREDRHGSGRQGKCKNSGTNAIHHPTPLSGFFRRVTAGCGAANEKGGHVRDMTARNAPRDRIRLPFPRRW